MKKVLIAGGTGMVGQALLPLLKGSGYDINILSTRKNAQVEGAEVFYWNPQNFDMDPNALNEVEAVINLAGATVDHRWTPEYKQRIMDSRTRTAETILRAAQQLDDGIKKTYLSASGVNYYPSSLTQVFTESDEPGNGFLAQVCQHWEAGADKMESVNWRVVKLRIGMVLSNKGGALAKLMPIAKSGFNAPVGSGKQWVSWIHIQDLCSIMLHAMTNESMRGVYNAVAPNPVTNTDMTRILSKAVHRPAFMPPVPGFLLKTVLGQMSTIVLEGQNCSAQKIQQSGFDFHFPSMPEALADLV